MSTVQETPAVETHAAFNTASGTSSSARAKRRTATHLPGEEGTWVFILGDMTVFALLFGVYVTAWSKDPSLFGKSQAVLNQNFGAINTLLLLCSSLLVVTAIRAIRAGASRLAPPMVLGAMACGFGFCLTKYLEWSDHLGHDLTPATNEFWQYYYILTGLHFFHLLLGLCVLAFIYQQSKKESLSQRAFVFVEGGACFWHMVDLLWIVLFPLLYLVK